MARPIFNSVSVLVLVADPSVLLTSLLSDLAPPLLSDLLKLLTSREHNGNSVTDALRENSDLNQVYKTLVENKYLANYHEDYYLLPYNKFRELDVDRIPDIYLTPTLNNDNNTNDTNDYIEPNTHPDIDTYLQPTKDKPLTLEPTDKATHESNVNDVYLHTNATQPGNANDTYLQLIQSNHPTQKNDNAKEHTAELRSPHQLPHLQMRMASTQNKYVDSRMMSRGNVYEGLKTGTCHYFDYT